MNVERIAEKLQPLMPEKVRRWMRTRELAEPDVRALIEKQIISTAYNYLGDFHNKILLSLPPESKAKGVINLGTILYHPSGLEIILLQAQILEQVFSLDF